MRERKEGKRVEWEVVWIPPWFNLCSWQSATGTPNRFSLVIFVPCPAIAFAFFFLVHRRLFICLF